MRLKSKVPVVTGLAEFVKDDINQGTLKVIAQTAQAPGISIVSDKAQKWADKTISLSTFLQALVTTMQAQEAVKQSA